MNWYRTLGNKQPNTMVHNIIFVIVGAIMGKDSILRLRTSSWAIFDMLPMCLFSKATLGFTDCMFCLMIWKALWSRFIQRDYMLDLQYTYFIKAILSAPRDRWRQYIQHKVLIQCFENGKYTRARHLKKNIVPTEN